MRNCRTATRPSRACCASICRRASPPGGRGPSWTSRATIPACGCRTWPIRSTRAACSTHGPDPVRGRAAGIVARRASSGFVSGGLYAAEAYLAARGEPAHPSDLREQDCIGFMRADGAAARWPLPAATSASRCSPRAVSVNGAPAGGAGRRRGPLGGDQEPYVRAGLLRRILPQWRVAPLPVHALKPASCPRGCGRWRHLARRLD